MPNVLFRADGNTTIGLGHVMRSLALVAMLRDEYTCYFAIQTPSQSLKDIIQKDCNNIIELQHSDEPTIIELGHHLNNIDIVVLDGYHFNELYRKNVKKYGCKVVCIDDMHMGHISADAVINHAPGIIAEKYDTDVFTELCLGTEYALLRSDFLSASKNARDIEKIDTAFVCFGGSDVYDLTKKTLDALLNVHPITTINLVIGSAYTHSESLKEYITSTTIPKTINIYSNLSAVDIIKVMSESQLAIVPASGICLEVMSVGMPLVLGKYADNQKDILSGCEKLQCCISIDSFINIDPIDFSTSITNYIQHGKWKEHIYNQKNILTGDSDKKVSKIFNELIKERAIIIRKADQNDVYTYFNWANDADVRNNAVNTQPIFFENHIKWFSKKLLDDTSSLYYLEYNGQPLGQVRLDKEDNEYTIDYSIDKNFRSQGFAKILLRKSLKEFIKNRPRPIILKAVVRPNNIQSSKTFLNLNFLQVEDINIDNVNYNVFIKEI